MIRTFSSIVCAEQFLPKSGSNNSPRSRSQSLQWPLWNWYDRADLERIQRFLATFEVVWPEPSEFAAAYQLLLTHRLSSGLNIPDWLIAATALTRSARLYTFNFKHFQVVPGLDVERPYSRP